MPDSKKIKDRWSPRLPRGHPCLRLGVKAQQKRALGKGGYSCPSLLGRCCSAPPALLALTAALQSRAVTSFFIGGFRERGVQLCPQNNCSGSRCHLYSSSRPLHQLRESRLHCALLNRCGSALRTPDERLICGDFAHSLSWFALEAAPEKRIHLMWPHVHQQQLQRCTCEAI